MTYSQDGKVAVEEKEVRCDDFSVFPDAPVLLAKGEDVVIIQDNSTQTEINCLPRFS